jgi:AraC-like DNA-binding protein
VSLCLAGERGRPRARHAHDSLTLGVVTAGTRRIETPDGSAVVATGEVFALPPGLAHSCAALGGDCAYTALSVAAELLPPGFPPVPPLRLDDAELAALILNLAEAMQSPAGGLERQSLLAETLERLAAAALPADAPKAGEPPGEMIRAVARARELLEEDLEGGLDLHALAEACGAPPYALHRAFTRITGLPPHAFQAHARLRRAKELLRAGASLSDAALGAGFCDQSHMNRHFARLAGLPPAQYARAHARR